MDNRPIGVFDSGLGGIGVLQACMAELPGEDFVYFGDTANAPYGDKPPETVKALSERAFELLLSKGCKAVVIACNTATSAAAETLRAAHSLPIIGMEPALKPADLLPGEGKILVLATSVTLRLPKFQRLMALYGKDAVPIPCPGLVDCVERGVFRGSEIDALLARYLGAFRGERIKAVVLGCTHYPFLRTAFAAYFSGVPLIDGSAGTARQLRRRLTEENRLAGLAKAGRVELLSSQEGGSPRMAEMLEKASLCDLEQALRIQAETHPVMEPVDAVKLIYQNEFGGGHLIQNSEESLRRIRAEWEAAPPSDVPLTEPLGNGWVRANLAALSKSGITPETLNRVFAASVKTARGSAEGLTRKFALLRELAAEDVFPFDEQALLAFWTEYQKIGMPPVSHSEAYKKACAPAYRVVRAAYLCMID